jgi:hypothetical protein
LNDRLIVGGVNSDEQPPQLVCEAYRITLDDGRESFEAVSLEEEGSETAWIMSDVVYGLDAMR